MERKIYNENMVRASTLLAGPLAAAYLMAENYKALGQEKQARQTLRGGAMATLLIFGTLWVLPAKVLAQIPYFLLPVLFALLAQFCVRKLQTQGLEAYLSEGGQQHSGWKVARVSGLVLALELLAGAGLFFGYFLVFG